MKVHSDRRKANRQAGVMEVIIRYRIMLFLAGVVRHWKELPTQAV